MPIIWFLVKTLVFLFVYVWLRAALPRLRYDQLMDLGWKRLIPLTLGWLMIVAAVVVWHWWGLVVAVAVVAAAGLLRRAFAVGSSGEHQSGGPPPMGAKAGPASLFGTAPRLSAPSTGDDGGSGGLPEGAH